jgi:hypothetical protein
MLRSCAILVVSLAFTSACSGDTATIGRSVEDVAGFCADWAERACTEAVVTACSFPSPSACQETQEGVCRDLVPEDKYSSVKARPCLEAVGSAYGDGVLTPDERDLVLHLGGVCSEVLSGSIGRGGNCTEDSDCDRTKGFSCVKKGAKGTCQEAVATENGGDCSSDESVCKEGYYCDATVLHCIEGKKAGFTCSSASPCAAGFRCQDEQGATIPPGNDTEGTCAALGAIGDDCEADDHCESGICTLRSSGTSGVCSAKTTLTPSDPLCDF